MGKKITLVCLKNTNIGDSVIADTCEFLIRKVNDTVCIKRMNLFPDQIVMSKFKKCFWAYKLFRSLLKWLRNPYWMNMEFKRWVNFTPQTNYYKSNLEGSDIVVIAGGGLVKHSRENFWDAIYSITDYCSSNNIPIYFNAVGVEGYDKKNFRCKILTECLNRSNVSITTRDDLQSLIKYCPDKPVSVIGDPALYTSETYGVVKNQNSDVIGIGLMRGKIYTDYGVDFKEDKIVNAYISIINQLEKHNCKWQLFCNGLKSDYLIGEKILRRMGLPVSENTLAAPPKSSEELVNLIAKYKAVVAARLHANIISTSLGIPSVGLVWNDKLKLFGQLIGASNRYISRDKFLDGEYVFSQLEEALKYGYDIDVINDLKKRSLLKMEQIIHG